MTEFQDRVVLVTGGTSGIGAGIARAFARQGARVVSAGIADADGEALAEEIRAGGGDARHANLDVRSEAGWISFVDGLARSHGRLDVVVNSAGILVAGGIEEVSFETYKRVMDVSLDGSFLALKHCLPLLKDRADDASYASVVLISSVAAFRGSAGALSYAASRAAMLSMARSAALDFAGRGYRIRVNTVHPGSVRTELSNVMYGKLMDAGKTMDEAVQYMAGLHPLGRLGTTDDIAEAVIYLSSDRASWITGTSLTVDGGRMA